MLDRVAVSAARLYASLDAADACALPLPIVISCGPLPLRVDAATVDAGDVSGIIEQRKRHTAAQRFVAAGLVEADLFELPAQIAAAL